MESFTDLDIGDSTDQSNEEGSTDDGAGIRESNESVEKLLIEASQSHLPESVLRLYIEGRADEVLAARIRGHVRNCRDCEARYYRVLMSISPGVVRAQI